MSNLFLYLRNGVGACTMINTYNLIGFSILSLEDFEDNYLAQATLEEFLKAPSPLRPTAAGIFEATIKNPSIEVLTELWMNVSGNDQSNKIKWRAGQVALSSSKFSYDIAWDKKTAPSFPGISGHGAVSAFVEDQQLLSKFIEFINILCSTINCVYAEIRNMSFPGWDRPIDIPLGLPEPAWYFVLGEPYYNLFGKQMILSTPAKVTKISSKMYSFQLSGNIFHPLEVNEKQNIINHFGIASYMSNSKRCLKGGVYPAFDFTKVCI